MSTWLLGVCAAVALTGTSHKDSDTVSANDTFAPLNWIDARAKLMAGRVLGNLVQKGMTEGEAQCLLWPLPRPLTSGGLAGGQLWFSRCYYDYGLAVSFSGDRSRPIRVDAVYFFKPRR